MGKESADLSTFVLDGVWLLLIAGEKIPSIAETLEA
jgi:hypothetical protein